MIRAGAWLAAAMWLMSATVAGAGAPPVVEGPSLEAAPTPCCASSGHRSCREALLDWLSYHETTCVGCGWCHNCSVRQPPLYTFFLDYGWNSDGGWKGHGQNGCSSPGGKTCAYNACSPKVIEKASKP
jgi:hypothetical protein